MSEHLHLEETDVDGVHIVAARGELDMSSAPGLCARLDTARLNGVAKVLLDLSDLSFCDSQGLRALILEHQEMQAAGKRFGVVEPLSNAVTDILELVGAREFLRLYGSRNEALVAL